MEISQTSNSAPPAQKTSSAASAAATTKPKSTQLDYDAFLKLLIAQMQNQDPLEPMNSSDYVAQLATFSQVEQSVQSNSRLAELLTATRMTQAEALIGRTLTTADGAVSGTVVSTKLDSGGIVAVLDGNREVRIQEGVTFSGAAV